MTADPKVWQEPEHPLWADFAAFSRAHVSRGNLVDFYWQIFKEGALAKERQMNGGRDVSR